MTESRDLSWTKKKIGDICKVRRGSSPRPIADQRYFEGGTIPWIKIADATKSGKYLYDTKQKVNEFGASFSRLLPAGSLILAASGTLGYVQILGVPGCIHDGWLHLYEFDKADPHFLYYWLKANAHLSGDAAYGAAIQNINTELLRSFEIDLPPLPTQQRIAAILSAYDDLIENNTRRIAMLEEMARRLYEEWFVHFRFPGHEGAEFDGDLPRGWATKQMQDVVRLVMGQSPKSEFYNQSGEGLAFHQGVSDFGPFFPTDRLFCTVEGRIAEEGDILVSVRAPVGRINIATKKIVIGRGLCAIRSSTGHQNFLLSQLRDRFAEEDSMGSGAIFNAVTKKDMQTLDLVWPPVELMDRFEKVAHPFWCSIRNLSDKNANLRAQRDLLLPKLVSGEIDVSGAEETMEAAE